MNKPFPVKPGGLFRSKEEARTFGALLGGRGIDGRVPESRDGVEAGGWVSSSETDPGWIIIR